MIHNEPQREASQALFLSCFKKHFRIYKACEEADIHRGTYYLWMKDPVFKAQFDDVKSKLWDLTESNLYDYLLEKDKDVTIFVAKSMKDFQQKQSLDVSVTGPIQIIVNKDPAKDVRDEASDADHLGTT